MTIVGLGMERVLAPEILIAFAEKVGTPDFTRMTRDEPDFDKLMHFRIDLMRKLGRPTRSRTDGSWTGRISSAKWMQTKDA